MNILFITHRIPYPPNKGDKLRAFHILQYLAKNHKIHLVSLYDDKDDRKHEPALRRFCEEIHLFYLNPLLARCKAFLCLFTGRPVSLGYFHSRAMQGQIDRTIRSGSVDLIFCYSSSMAQYVDRAARIPKIMDFGDCDSAKWGQYSGRSRFPFSWIYAREKKCLEAYEKQIVRDFDRCLVVSEPEQSEFARFTATDKFEVLMNGVDTDYFQPLTVPLPRQEGERKVRGTDRKALIFTGAMDYFANIDGVLFFLKEILPLIRKQFPDVEFYIVGKNPPSSIRRLAREKGIFVTGQVADVREYLKKAAVSVAPLRIAQGVQNKVLEAMASGLPVVATSKSIAALNAIPDQDLLVADTPGDFAQKVILLLEDQALWQKIAASGTVYIEHHHDWESNLKVLNMVLHNLSSTNSPSPLRGEGWVTGKSEVLPPHPAFSPKGEKEFRSKWNT